MIKEYIVSYMCYLLYRAPKLEIVIKICIYIILKQKLELYIQNFIYIPYSWQNLSSDSEKH